MSAPAARNDLTMLQAGRGMAALLVVFYHLTGLFAAEKYWNTEVFAGAFHFGYAGVEFFFVLSGYIILHAHRADIGSGRVSRYLSKRALRVYPLYWAVTIALAALYFVTDRSRLAFVPNSVVLVGPNTEAVLGVAWTLFHEILFYLIFVALLIDRRFGIVVMVGWLIACTIWFDRTPPHYALSSVNLLFGIGMVALLLGGRINAPRPMWWIGIALFVAVGVEVTTIDVLSEDQRELAFGLSAGLFVFGAVHAEREGRLRAPPAFRLLGDASYALYLVHYPILAILAKIWISIPFLRALPAQLSFLIMAAICVAMAIAIHQFFERPMMAFLQRRLLPRDRPVAARA